MDQIQVRTELLSHQQSQALKAGDAWFYSYVIFGSLPGTQYWWLSDRCYFLTIYFFPASHSRAEWPREANIPTYIPKFRNGWEPPIEIFRGAPWEIDIGHLQEEVSFVLWTIPFTFPFSSSEGSAQPTANFSSLCMWQQRNPGRPKLSGSPFPLLQLPPFHSGTADSVFPLPAIISQWISLP